MTEPNWEPVRENLLDAIAGYRLVRDFQTTGNVTSFLEYQKIIHDMQHKDFQMSLGYVSLITILLKMVKEITGRSEADILAVLGQSAATME